MCKFSPAETEEIPSVSVISILASSVRGSVRTLTSLWYPNASSNPSIKFFIVFEGAVLSAFNHPSSAVAVTRLYKVSSEMII
jgi:hypothetical protein